MVAFFLGGDLVFVVFATVFLALTTAFLAGEAALRLELRVDLAILDLSFLRGVVTQRVKMDVTFTSALSTVVPTDKKIRWPAVCLSLHHQRAYGDNI